jgi:two-component system, response regulator PdtaR
MQLLLDRACRGGRLILMTSDDDVSSEAPGPRRGEETAGRSARRRLLIVEDEWFISLSIEDTVKEAGYEVVDVVASAEEAVAAALAHQPDLVLMDIRLVGPRDGIDAALEIYRRLGTRSVFVSAHVDGHTRERASAAAPAGWLSKPFAPAELLQAIRQALAQ